MRIAIKLPDTTREIVLTYPLLHAINRLMDKRVKDGEIENFEFHFLCQKDVIAVLNLLPFTAFYHELEPDDVKNVFTVHRAIKNAKIDFIDVFISTTTSFNDASMGKNLNADVRGGFNISKNKLFINRPVPYSEGLHKSQQYFNLINVFELAESTSIPTVGARNLDPFFTDWVGEPYYVVNLSKNVEAAFDPQWEDFFGLFKDTRFVLLSDRLTPEEYDVSMAATLAKLSAQNIYRLFNPADMISFGKVVAHSKAFISFDSDLLHLAAYAGAYCFWLNDRLPASMERPEFMYCDIRHFNLQEPIYKKDGKINYSPIFDELHQFITKELESSDASK